VTSRSRLRIAIRAFSILCFVAYFALSINPPQALFPMIARAMPNDLVKALNKTWPIPEGKAIYFKSEVPLYAEQSLLYFVPATTWVLVTPTRGYLYVQPPWHIKALLFALYALFIDGLIIATFILASGDARLQFQAQRADYNYRVHIISQRRDIQALRRLRSRYIVDCVLLSISCVWDAIQQVEPPSD
jgi:hypothetical protein